MHLTLLHVSIEIRSTSHRLGEATSPSLGPGALPAHAPHHPSAHGLRAQRVRRKATPQESEGGRRKAERSRTIDLEKSGWLYCIVMAGNCNMIATC